jgi:urocanate hydratase
MSTRAASARLETGYCDRMARRSGRRAGAFRCARAQIAGEAISVGLVGNCADVLPELARRGVVPDVLTDQTSAHDPLNGYVPHGMTLEEARRAARRDPASTWSARPRMGVHVERHAGAAKARRGDVRLRQQHPHPGRRRPAWRTRFDIPGFVPEYIRPLFCEGRGPFRWVALSGDPEDIYRTDRLALELFPHDETLARWMPLAREAHPVSRACRRASAGWATASAPNSAWPSTGWCARAN